eukprot:CAMPEP_0202815334 /NCGR_PEP_ID=MMETSP1389-20130828/6145_1 /ASSEMBLY_ACC=CAM_ASM_000865 /TAXON_ID=302021 /ORGANISM="Rhodomonas sp., Strain CCMP768" /LENGTH=110 /DNA_ID=CAMNT_0049487217 /DNA_START=45 /DNA_END=374 /DNA_ORIENTATION=-
MPAELLRDTREGTQRRKSTPDPHSSKSKPTDIDLADTTSGSESLKVVSDSEASVLRAREARELVGDTPLAGPRTVTLRRRTSAQADISRIITLVRRSPASLSTSRGEGRE